MATPAVAGSVIASTAVVASTAGARDVAPTAVREAAEATADRPPRGDPDRPNVSAFADRAEVVVLPERARATDVRDEAVADRSDLRGVPDRPETPSTLVVMLDRPDKPGWADKAERPEKPDHPEKVERPDKPERPELFNRPDRPERPELVDRPDKPERPELFDRPDRPERPELVDRPDKPERPELVDRPDKPDRPERPDKPDKPDKPERPERPT
jgi:hypothetical protein